MTITVDFAVEPLKHKIDGQYDNDPNLPLSPAFVVGLPVVSGCTVVGANGVMGGTIRKKKLLLRSILM